MPVHEKSKHCELGFESYQNFKKILRQILLQYGLGINSFIGLNIKIEFYKVLFENIVGVRRIILAKMSKYLPLCLIWPCR